SFREAGISLAEMSVQTPTLDEVFLTITVVLATPDEVEAAATSKKASK
ncbi:daunorubicin/doxorubicin resistance ABC transporter ATP-binding protein DrrA, partial [Bacillus sp. S34]|nr:daunorubicin/doxorubicin resistance ABC transporter ATP-binding protein DrrA [Bacillus sp. S34]